ncbi:MAG: chemotaxis protein CheW [Coriobacteriia bacterium]|nr:chemotaxis protein CheW [Coriobacteriia bacterium]
MGAEVHGSLVERAEEILRHRAETLAQEAAEEREDDRLALLLFRLDEEWYAVRLEDVREIHQECHITPIPCVPDFILGVVNVRGEIVSVTDLARLMRADHQGTECARPAAIVLQGTSSVTAAVVDEIGDIAEVAADSVEPPLSTIDRRRAEFVAGSVPCKETVVGLLDVERVLEPVGETTGR